MLLWITVGLQRPTIIYTMVKLVSLDTSTTCTGVAVYVDGEYVSSKVLPADKKLNKDERFTLMAKQIIAELEKQKPDIVVIEDDVVKGSMAIVTLLSKLIGVVRGYCITRDIFYCELPPSSWRKPLGIQKSKAKREELKQLALDFVRENISDDEMISDDQSDAICIGYAYITIYS